MSEIISPGIHSEKVSRWKKLSAKAELTDGICRMMAEGEHMAGEALACGKAQCLIVSENACEKYAYLIEKARLAGITVYHVSERVYAYLCDTKTPQGISAECEIRTVLKPGEAKKSVILERVQDPGNVGTVLRTADAAGFDLLVCDRETANPFSPKALRASMGAVFRVPVMICDHVCPVIREIKETGADVLAGDLRGSDLFSADYNAGQVCILVGNEGSGISAEAAEEATKRVRIPMPGRAESLNAGVAASILMYDVIRRNRTE